MDQKLAHVQHASQAAQLAESSQMVKLFASLFRRDGVYVSIIRSTAGQNTFCYIMFLVCLWWIAHSRRYIFSPPLALIAECSLYLKSGGKGKRSLQLTVIYKGSVDRAL